MANLINLGGDIDNLSPNAKAMLDGLASNAGLPDIRVRSGYRDPTRNAKAGGANNSQHVHRNALDLDISGYDDGQKRSILDAAIGLGARGVGIYPSGSSLHLDVRDTPTVWGWHPAGAYKSADVSQAEEWARESLSKLMAQSPSVTPTAPASSISAKSRALPSWWNSLEQQAATAGVDSDVLYRIGGAESMFRNVPNAGGTSSAHGPFQIIEGTWNGVAKSRPDLNLTNRLDPEQQAKAAPWILKEYTDIVHKRIGRVPTAGEQYLAWFLGPHDAAKVLSAPSGAAVNGIISPDSIGANPDVFKAVQSVDDMRAWAEKKMSGEGLDGTIRDTPEYPPVPDMGRGFGILKSPDPYNDIERAQMEKRRDEESFGFGRGAWEAMKQESVIGWAFEQAGRPAPDVNFTVSQELLKERAADVPTQYLGYLSDSHSSADFDQRLNRLRKDIEVEQKLAAMGATGIGLRLGASIVDPAGWLATVAASPIGGAIKGGRVARILAGAAEGATANLALEGVMSQLKPTWEAENLIYAGAGGLAFGAAFGSMGRNVANAEEANTLVKHSRELMSSVEMGRSVGAAQNPASRNPIRTDISEYLNKNFADAQDNSALNGWHRWDLTGRLKASENPLVRALGNLMPEETVGQKKGGATSRAITEDQIMIQRRFDISWSRAYRSAWSDFKERNKLGWAAGMNGEETAFRQQITAAIRSTDPLAEFDPAVMRMKQEWNKISAAYVKLTQGDHLALDGTQRAPMKGWEGLSESDTYVPRLVHWQRFRELQDELGSNGMARLISQAIQGRNADIEKVKADKIAAGYVKRLEQVEAGQELSAARIFSSLDMDEMRMNLENVGLDPEDIEMVVGGMAGRDAGKAGQARGKRRQLLDENFSMTLQTKNGPREVRVAELFHDDAQFLFESYNRQMSGAIAMSRLRVENPNWRPGEEDLHPRYLVDGVHSRADWEKVIKQVRAIASSEGATKGMRESVDADVDRLQFLFDGITGTPSKFDQSNMASAVRMIRDYNFLRVMGQVGMAQLAEIGMITCGLGLKTAIRSMPGLRAFMRDARTGKLADADAEALEWISTAGTDTLRGMSHIVTDDFGAPITNAGKSSLMLRAEGAMSRGARAMTVVSGMAPINAYLQRWASKAVLQKFIDMSEEGARVNRKRMRVLGLSDEMQDRIFEAIRKNAGETTGEREGSKLKRLNLEKWNPEVRGTFEHAIFRWTRKIIQENDLGQTNTILGHTLGKLFFQFRGFMLGAWTKNTLHNAHMRDWESMSMILGTMTFGSLAYVGQTHLQAIGRSDREDWLEKRLSPQKVAAAAFQRAGFYSIFPAVADNMAYVAGFDPLFDSRVTGQPSQGLTAFPALGMIDNAMNSVRGVAGAVQGNPFSQPDARAMFGTLPFQNTLPMLWFANTAIRGLPEKDSR
ncbi:D-Ala-D-Ala carboxypeptidase family metallohydrolase [Agrobacterium sp. 22-209-1]